MELSCLFCSTTQATIAPPGCVKEDQSVGQRRFPSLTSHQVKVKLRTVSVNPRKKANRQRVESGGAVKNNSEGNWMNLLLVLFYQNQLDLFNWQQLPFFWLPGCSSASSSRARSGSAWSRSRWISAEAVRIETVGHRLSSVFGGGAFHPSHHTPAGIHANKAS